MCFNSKNCRARWKHGVPKNVMPVPPHVGVLTRRWSEFDSAYPMFDARFISDILASNKALTETSNSPASAKRIAEGESAILTAVNDTPERGTKIPTVRTRYLVC